MEGKDEGQHEEWEELFSGGAAMHVSVLHPPKTHCIPSTKKIGGAYVCVPASLN